MKSSAKRAFSCIRDWPFNNVYVWLLPTNSVTIPAVTTTPSASASINSISENPCARRMAVIPDCRSKWLSRQAGWAPATAR